MTRGLPGFLCVLFQARQAWLQLNGESSDPMNPMIPRPSLRELLKDRAKSMSFSEEWRRMVRSIGGIWDDLGAKPEMDDHDYL